MDYAFTHLDEYSPEVLQKCNENLMDRVYIT